MEMESSSSLPPGFRFHPTEEELVGYYLNRKVNSLKIDLDVIVEIDLYRVEPWDIQERCKLGFEEKEEWYFFSHKDRKYPTGRRTNRATAAGFWKATGIDKAVVSKNKIIGMRKTLVFYRGRAPSGSKTDWIMHEYRLHTSQQPPQEEGWVVCRAFKKPSPNHQRQGWVVLGSREENGTTFNGWASTTTTTTTTTTPRQMACYPLIQSSTTIMQSSSSSTCNHHHHLENQLIIELPQVADSPTLSAKGASSSTDDQCSAQYAAVDWNNFDDMVGSQQQQEQEQTDHEPPSLNDYSSSCFSFISQDEYYHQIINNNDTIAHDHTSSHLFTCLPY